MIITGADKDFPQVSTGMHPAILYMMVDIGRQKSEYMGQTKISREIVLAWEIKDEFMDDGRPLAISKFYKLSTFEKGNLFKDILSWTGERIGDGYCLSKLLTMPSLLNIVENEHGKPKIASVNPLPKGMSIDPVHNTPVSFNMPPLGEYDETVFQALPAWLKKKIEASPEYMEIKGIQSPTQGQARRQAKPAGHTPQVDADPNHPINAPVDPADYYGM